MPTEHFKRYLAVQIERVTSQEVRKSREQSIRLSPRPLGSIVELFVYLWVSEVFNFFNSSDILIPP